MVSSKARTQWPKAVVGGTVFNSCELTVDLKQGLCELHIGNITAGLSYPDVLALLCQLEVVRDLLEPPAPAGKTYAPKMSNY